MNRSGLAVSGSSFSGAGATAGVGTVDCVGAAGAVSMTSATSSSLFSGVTAATGVFSSSLGVSVGVTSPVSTG